MSYHLTKLAGEDLAEIGDYIARENRRAAAKLVAAITRKFEFLAEHPHLHPVDTNYRNLCKSKVGNYLILYRSIEDNVEIVRVIHGARDVENILKKVEQVLM